MHHHIFNGEPSFSVANMRENSFSRMLPTKVDTKHATKNASNPTIGQTRGMGRVCDVHEGSTCRIDISSTPHTLTILSDQFKGFLEAEECVVGRRTCDVFSGDGNAQ